MKKHLCVVLTLMMAALSLGAQTLNIGGHRAACDTLNHIWLCSVPQSVFGDDYSAQVSYGEELTDLVIEGVAVASGETMLFEGIEGGKLYTVTAHLGDSLITGSITFTWLPIVEINGTFNNSFKYGTVTVSEPDSAFAEPMQAKVKWRGGATNTGSKHKRNYRIKFIAEDSTKMNRRFFGLRNDNSWNLDAGQMDFLRVRNRVSTDLWLDMARKPWYADSVNNVRNGSRGQMVEVLLNGAYVGIYNMCEPIDRKQLKLKRYDVLPNRRIDFRGQLWTAYKWTRTVSMSDPQPRGLGTTLWDGFELKYPDRDEVKTVKWTALNDAVWFANRADADISLRADSMGYYFDLPVMQDYYIFIIALQAIDNESKNIYYGCYDTKDAPRLTMVPWDLDICLGQNYSPSVDYPDMIKPNRGLDWIAHLPMADMMDVPEYHDQVFERYWQLRETKLNTDSLVDRYRAAVRELEECGAAEREENRWSKDTDLAGKDLDLSAEMDYVEDWIRKRMEYLDTYVFSYNPPPIPIKGDVNGDGEVNIADINALINIIMGGSADDDTLKRADVNEDDEINIADINALIDLILG
jgi:hypothetical protein